MSHRYATRRTLVRGRAVAGGESPEFQQFLTRAPTLDVAHTNFCRTLINGLVTDSLWSKLDCLYVFAAQDPTNAAINLKSSSFPITTVSSPGFVADQGWTGNTTSSYWKNGFIPSTAGGVFTLNSAHFSAYIRTPRTTGANKAPCGCSNAAFTNVSYLGPNQVSVIDEVFINASTSNTLTPVGTAQGFWSVSRTGASAGALYRNGSSLFAVTTTSTGLPDSEWYFGCLDLSGPSRLSDDQIAAATIGAGLNATEQGNLSSRINAYMTALGTNVYP